MARTEAARAQTATKTRVADSEAAQEVLGLAFEFVARLQDASASVAAEHRLTLPQLKALYALKREGAQAMNRMAAKLQCDASNVTMIFDRLEERGLAERQADPSDRRVKRLVLTPEGDALCEGAWDEIMARTPLARLDAKQQQRLRDLLREALGPDARIVMPCEA